MKTTPWMIIVAALVTSLASCSQLETLSSLTTPDSKKEAYARWNKVRGRLKYQLAADSFAAGQLDKAQEHLNETIALNPNNPDNYVLLAKLLLERGEIASASEAIEKAQENGGSSAEIDYLNGMIAQRYGRFVDALYWYQQASTRETNSAHYVAAVAETLVALDRAVDALALVRSRWTDFEQNATLREIAGSIHMMLDQYEEAADAYQEAARITTDDVLLKFKLGEALTLAGRYEEARSVLITAHDMAKDTPPSALVLLGRCNLALERNDEALEVLQEAAEKGPNNPRYWSWLARAALASHDLLTARRAANQTVAIDSDNPHHHMMLGFVCMRQRDYEAAVASFEKTLQDSPNDRMAQFLLAKAHVAMGKPATALAYDLQQAQTHTSVGQSHQGSGSRESSLIQPTRQGHKRSVGRPRAP